MAESTSSRKRLTFSTRGKRRKKQLPKGEPEVAQFGDDAGRSGDDFSDQDPFEFVGSFSSGAVQARDLDDALARLEFGAE